MVPSAEDHVLNTSGLLFAPSRMAHKLHTEAGSETALSLYIKSAFVFCVGKALFYQKVELSAVSSNSTYLFLQYFKAFLEMFVLTGELLSAITFFFFSKVPKN